MAMALVLFALRGFPAPQPAIERPGSADAPREVSVIMRDYRFQPEPLRLIPGERVRFTILNGGLEPHEFVLGDDAVQRAWQAADAAATPPLPLTTAPPASVPLDTGGLRVLLGSGGEASAVFDVPETGELLLICHIPGHREAGMIGEVQLVVPGVEGSPAVSR